MICNYCFGLLFVLRLMFNASHALYPMFHIIYYIPRSTFSNRNISHVPHILYSRDIFHTPYSIFHISRCPVPHSIFHSSCSIFDDPRFTFHISYFISHIPFYIPRSICHNLILCVSHFISHTTQFRSVSNWNSKEESKKCP